MRGKFIVSGDAGYMLGRDEGHMYRGRAGERILSGKLIEVATSYFIITPLDTTRSIIINTSSVHL